MLAHLEARCLLYCPMAEGQYSIPRTCHYTNTIFLLDGNQLINGIDDGRLFDTTDIDRGVLGEFCLLWPAEFCVYRPSWPAFAKSVTQPRVII